MLIFLALPSMTPWLAVPGCVGVFIALALAIGLVVIADLKKIAHLVRNKLEWVAPSASRGP